MFFTDICAQWSAKRAIEVALAGKHSIRFTGSHLSQAGALAHLARDLGLEAKADTPCPCGFYGHPRHACTCSIEKVTRWQRRSLHRFDIEIEVSDDADFDILAHLSGKQGEGHELIMERIDNRADYTDLSLDDTALSLLKAAIRQLSLNWPQVQTILSVSRTIANLAHRPHIETPHLAEAIQYRPRKSGTF